jgi:hypothetical protein
MPRLLRDRNCLQPAVWRMAPRLVTSTAGTISNISCNILSHGCLKEKFLDCLTSFGYSILSRRGWVYHGSLPRCPVSDDHTDQGLLSGNPSSLTTRPCELTLNPGNLKGRFASLRIFLHRARLSNWRDLSKEDGKSNVRVKTQLWSQSNRLAWPGLLDRSYIPLKTAAAQTAKALTTDTKFCGLAATSLLLNASATFCSPGQ